MSVAILLCFGFGLYAQSGNNRDETTGYIFAVSNMKYVKMFMFGISYLLLMLIFLLKRQNFGLKIKERNFLMQIALAILVQLKII